MGTRQAERGRLITRIRKHRKSSHLTDHPLQPTRLPPTKSKKRGPRGTGELRAAIKKTFPKGELRLKLGYEEAELPSRARWIKDRFFISHPRKFMNSLPAGLALLS